MQRLVRLEQALDLPDQGLQGKTKKFMFSAPGERRGDHLSTHLPLIPGRGLITILTVSY
jgi:hypothetical protein